MFRPVPRPVMLIYVRAGEASCDARSQEGAGDRREHPAGWPAKSDPGAARRRTFRPGALRWKGCIGWRRASNWAMKQSSDTSCRPADINGLENSTRCNAGGQPHLRRLRLLLRSCRCGATNCAGNPVACTCKAMITIACRCSSVNAQGRPMNTRAVPVCGRSGRCTRADDRLRAVVVS
jgi:hypothetical protein